MNSHDPKSQLSIAQVIAMVKSRSPDELSLTDAQQVRGRLIEMPALHVLLDGAEAVDRYVARIDRRLALKTSEQETMEVPRGLPTRKKRWRATAALVLTFGGVAWFWAHLHETSTGTNKVTTEIQPATLPQIEVPIVAKATQKANPSIEPSVLLTPAPGAVPLPMPEKPMKAPEPTAPQLLDGVVVLNDPKGEYRVPFTAGHERVKLQGRIGKLRIESADGDAVIDAAGLIAESVEVAGEINGNAKLHLSAPQGEVKIPRTINGLAEVVIFAPGGSVILGRDHENAINGATRVMITAAKVDIRGDVAGSARVDLSIDGAGKLSFAHLSGSVRLACGQPDGSAALSEMVKGKVDPGAEFALVDHAK